MKSQNAEQTTTEPETDVRHSTTEGRSRLWLNVTAPLIATSAFFLLVVTQTQFTHIFELDPDEGYNLIKALLLEQGHVLYADIWSDQPPLYAYFLRAFFNQVGWSVENARFLTLLFSSLLILALYDSVRMVGGHLSAATAVVLLVASSNYAQLSVAVMVGLPAITLAISSIWMLTRWQLSRSRWFLAASGVLLACSLATKLFTAFLVPVLGLVVLLSESGRGGWRNALPSGLVWAAAFAAALALLLGPALYNGAFGQLIGTHASSRDLMAAPGIGEFLRDDAFLFGLAAVGVGATLTRGPLGTPFAGWLLVAALGMLNHSPLWYHHVLLLSVPGSALSGLGLGAMLRCEKRTRSRLAGGAIAVSLLVVAVFYSHPVRLQELVEPPEWMSTSKALDVERVLARYSEDISSIMSSRQIYAFRLGLATPPNLAVTSLKRFRTGNIASEDILNELRTFKPEIVLVDNRWPRRVRRKLVAAMGDAYKRIYRARDHEDTQIFVLRELLERSGNGD